MSLSKRFSGAFLEKVIMPIKEALQFLDSLFQDEKIRRTVQMSVQGTAITAIGTLLGAFLLGPRGLIAGASLGGVLSYGLLENKFSGLVTIWNSLTPNKKAEVAQSFVQCLVDKLPTAVSCAVELLELVKCNKNLLYAILKFLSMYLNA